MPRVLIAHGSTQRLKRAVNDLQAVGFEVIATPDGGDAFARFFEESPDLVICSELLPGLSGVNFARMVRSQSPNTPVVILTESGTQAEAEGFYLMADPLDVQALCASFSTLAPAAPAAHPSDDATTTPNANEVFTLAALKRFQRGSNPLALLDDRGIQQLARITQHQIRQDGEQIIRQGDIGDGFYVVIEGQVRVTLQEKDDSEVARINEGGFFGEMALLSEQKRTASVWSVGTTTLLFVNRDEFLPILANYPSLRELLSGVALKRTEENLWSVLFADDDVQRSLAELDESGERAVAIDAAAAATAAAPSSELDLLASLEAAPDTGGVARPDLEGLASLAAEPRLADATDGAPAEPMLALEMPSEAPSDGVPAALDVPNDASATPSDAVAASFDALSETVAACCDTPKEAVAAAANEADDRAFDALAETVAASFEPRPEDTERGTAAPSSYDAPNDSAAAAHDVASSTGASEFDQAHDPAVAPTHDDISVAFETSTPPETPAAASAAPETSAAASAAPETPAAASAAPETPAAASAAPETPSTESAVPERPDSESAAPASLVDSFHLPDVILTEQGIVAAEAPAPRASAEPCPDRPAAETYAGSLALDVEAAASAVAREPGDALHFSSDEIAAAAAASTTAAEPAPGDLAATPQEATSLPDAAAFDAALDDLAIPAKLRRKPKTKPKPPGLWTRLGQNPAALAGGAFTAGVLVTAVIAGLIANRVASPPASGGPAGARAIQLPSSDQPQSSNKGTAAAGAGQGVAGTADALVDELETLPLATDGGPLPLLRQCRASARCDGADTVGGADDDGAAPADPDQAAAPSIAAPGTPSAATPAPATPAPATSTTLVPPTPAAATAAPAAAATATAAGTAATGAAASDTAKPPDTAAPAPPPAERREMRRELFAAVQAKDFKRAVDAGYRMRKAYELDWEAEYTLAEAERGAGKLTEALASYKGFVEKYPTNMYADDALFASAEILRAQGKTKEARALYQRVADTPKSNLKDAALQILGELK